MKKLLLMLSVLMVASACAGKPTPIPEPESAGGILFAEKCGICHSVPHPKRNTFEQWQSLMVLMQEQRLHRKMAPLTDDERKVIMRYLKRNAR
jgi:hypothetical protein